MSSVTASGTSDDSSVPANFVTYPIPSSGSAAMEPGFDSAAGTYMQHGNYDCFLCVCVFIFVFCILYIVCEEIKL